MSYWALDEIIKLLSLCVKSNIVHTLLVSLDVLYFLSRIHILKTDITLRISQNKVSVFR